ncbi:uncharacterized protein LOC122083734 [Macadamia integrifolia]|uniref:uncharacterized protein LOC122083734 n=1 Tax=Macadamia integrifolia TaxID=60698 RepID=UPI001C4F2FCF|nr:uncharacterized protein LOC122083734 [Macadamia integrifolia]
MSYLEDRHIVESRTCGGCGVEEESMEHALVYCPFVQKAWFVSPVALCTSVFPNLSLTEWILKWKGPIGSKVEMQICFASHALMAWEIWKFRNSCCFDISSPPPPFMTWIAKVNSYVREVVDLLSGSLPSLVLKQVIAVLPLAHSQNCMAIFSDAALSSVPKALGLGCATFDLSLRPCFIASAHHALAPPLVGEALAIRLALSLPRCASYSRVMVFSDCLTLTNSLSSPSSPQAPIVSIVHNIMSLKALFSLCSFSYISRSCNGSAHAVAKWTLSYPAEGFWIPPLPGELGRIVLACSPFYAE